jgi:hypothetical protein
MDSRIIDDYCRKSGDKEVPDGNLEENEHGFCVWRLDDSALIIAAIYGDGDYWNPWIDKKAKEEGMKEIIFATKRNPDSFIRKYGFKITGYILARTI